ncbi:MAG: TIGR02302 family protein [Alphaproteobacteria bacterium]|nr:TIGR02302 family protein [Alphaproteobacteria bacterium]
MASDDMPTGKTESRSLERTFEGKVRRAKLAMIFEQLWRRLWLVLAIVGVFILLSLFGVWQHLAPLPHKAILALFALALAVASVSIFVIRWPTRSQAIRRIERVSNLPHRPASSYEDTLTAAHDDAQTSALWNAHRKRLRTLFQRLRVGKPRPRTDRYDPFALRALMILLIATGLGFVGVTSFDRVKTAFQFSDTVQLANVRLDAWLSPPTYTTRPPLMLSDGAAIMTSDASTDSAEVLKPVTVPSGSTLVVRVSGLGARKAKVATYSSDSFADDNATPVAAEKSLAGGDVQEFRSKITEETMVRVSSKTQQLAKWYISVIPDALPTIKLIYPPLHTVRGSMKLTYNVQDDYGVSGAVAHFVEAKPKSALKSGTSRRQRSLAVTPPQRPKAPIEMKLRLPGSQSKDHVAQTFLDFAPHPWAGKRVVLSLKATDVAGQIGVSPGIEIVLPERKFTKPLARAVIEQRRKLFDDYPDARRREVALALNALTTDPEEFFEDTRVYLSLRAVYHRLSRSGAPAAIKSSIDQLWHTALRIEEGDLSDAERALREAHEKLAKALEEGASEEEIKKLMQELRQAMNNFMQQMAKENQDQQRDFTQGNDSQNQSVNQNDIDQMMRNIEELAKNGAREQAQQMLSQMRDMMERMQRGQANQQQARQQQQAMKAIKKLGGMVGKQQELMDDTFTQQHRGNAQQGQRQGQQRAPGQFGRPGQQGRPQRGGSPQRGMGPGQQQNQFGRGNQRGQRGQQGQGQQGQGQGQQPTASELAERQRQLREQLAQLQRQLAEQGLGQPQQLESARQAMQNAEQALQNQNLARATEEQARALSHMQQGARSMAQEMMSNSPQRFGSKGQERRDPLGRPQRSSGPELGTSVKVPEEIELQRAREIIDELRRRRGEVTRPMIELDYLDRLLRRF